MGTSHGAKKYIIKKIKFKKINKNKKRGKQKGNNA